MESLVVCLFGIISGLVIGYHHGAGNPRSQLDLRNGVQYEVLTTTSTIQGRAFAIVRALDDLQNVILVEVPLNQETGLYEFDSGLRYSSTVRTSPDFDKN
jgi:hypothetical protein